MVTNSVVVKTDRRYHNGITVPVWGGPGGNIPIPVWGDAIPEIDGTPVGIAGQPKGILGEPITFYVFKRDPPNDLSGTPSIEIINTHGVPTTNENTFLFNFGELVAEGSAEHSFTYTLTGIDLESDVTVALGSGRIDDYNLSITAAPTMGTASTATMLNTPLNELVFTPADNTVPADEGKLNVVITVTFDPTITSVNTLQAAIIFKGGGGVGNVDVASPGPFFLQGFGTGGATLTSTLNNVDAIDRVDFTTISFEDVVINDTESFTYTLIGADLESDVTATLAGTDLAAYTLSATIIGNVGTMTGTNPTLTFARSTVSASMDSLKAEITVTFSPTVVKNNQTVTLTITGGEASSANVGDQPPVHTIIGDGVVEVATITFGTPPAAFTNQASTAPATVPITSNVDFTVTASDPWITIVEPAGGLGTPDTDEITFTYTANPGAEREAALTAIETRTGHGFSRTIITQEETDAPNNPKITLTLPTAAELMTAGVTQPVANLDEDGNALMDDKGTPDTSDDTPVTRVLSHILQFGDLSVGDSESFTYTLVGADVVSDVVVTLEGTGPDATENLAAYTLSSTIANATDGAVIGSPGNILTFSPSATTNSISATITVTFEPTAGAIDQTATITTSYQQGGITRILELVNEVLGDYEGDAPTGYTAPSGTSRQIIHKVEKIYQLSGSGYATPTLATAPPINIDLTTTGVTLTPSTNTLEFGDVTIGESKTISYTLVGANLTSNVIVTLAGTGATATANLAAYTMDITLTDDLQENGSAIMNVGNDPNIFSLTPGNTNQLNVTITITFEPTAETSGQTATIATTKGGLESLNSDPTVATYNLTGNGIPTTPTLIVTTYPYPPVVESNDTDFDFQSIAIDAASNPSFTFNLAGKNLGTRFPVVTLTGAGTGAAVAENLAAYTITSMITNPADGTVAITDATTLTNSQLTFTPVAGTLNATVIVTFDPTLERADQDATITFTGGGAGVTLPGPYTLTGEGLAAGATSFSVGVLAKDGLQDDDDFDFGDVPEAALDFDSPFFTIIPVGSNVASPFFTIIPVGLNVASPVVITLEGAGTGTTTETAENLAAYTIAYTSIRSGVVTVTDVGTATNSQLTLTPAAGEINISIMVEFNPNVERDNQMATITFTGGGGTALAPTDLTNLPGPYTLTGNGVEPQPELSITRTPLPSNVMETSLNTFSFGDVFASSERSFTYTLVGANLTTDVIVTLSGANLSDYSIEATTPTTGMVDTDTDNMLTFTSVGGILDATITVTFSPTGAPSNNLTATIATTGGAGTAGASQEVNEPLANYTLIGNNIAIPTLSATPADPLPSNVTQNPLNTFNFGSILISTTRTFTYTLVGADLTTNAVVTLGGTNPGDYSIEATTLTTGIVDDQTNNVLTFTPVNKAVEAVITVTFNPSAEGTRMATLTTTGGAGMAGNADEVAVPQVDYSLTGNGIPLISVANAIAPVRESTPNTFDFQSIAIDAATGNPFFTFQITGRMQQSPLVITLTGAGTGAVVTENFAAYTISSMIADPTDGAVTITDAATATNSQLTFTPATGTLNATVTVTFNPSVERDNQMATITFTGGGGTALAPADLSNLPGPYTLTGDGLAAGTSTLSSVATVDDPVEELSTDNFSFGEVLTTATGADNPSFAFTITGRSIASPITLTLAGTGTGAAVAENLAAYTIASMIANAADGAVTGTNPTLILTPATGTLNATVTVTFNPSVVRTGQTATITFTGGGGVTLPGPYMLTGDGTTTATTVSSIDFGNAPTLVAAGSTTAVNVPITANVPFKVASDQTWITITAPTGGNGTSATNMVSFTYTANTTGSARTAILTATETGSGTETDNVMLTQPAGTTPPVTDPTLGLSNPTNAVQLSPNPVRNRLFVQGNGVLQVFVRDITGALFGSYELLGAGEIDFTSLPAGLYIVQVQTQTGNHTQRILRK